MPTTTPPSFQRSTSAKMFVVGALALLCIIPSLFIYGVIAEREGRLREAVADISSKWSSAQSVAGPVLVLPYTGKEPNDKGVQVSKRLYRTVSPTKLDMNVKLATETRSRGIFGVPVYTATITVRGTFEGMSSELKEYSSIAWNQANLQTAVSDSRGITEQPVLVANGKNSTFAFAGTMNYLPLSSAIQAPIAVNPAAPLEFSYTLVLRGTEYIEFMPTAKKANVTMESPWTGPSFIGNTLPTTYTLTDSGFTAQWDFAPWWSDSMQAEVAQNEYGMQQSVGSFGVKLIDTVNFYTLMERAVKYAILFIALTFMVFFLAEVLMKHRVHPFQYVLVGAALCLFYLLLLSLGEQIGFLPSYIVSTVATVGLITWYSASVLHGKKFAKIVCGLLVVLYAYLYALLQLEDYALLIGSVVLFCILAAVMYVTRSIDWYAVDRDNG